MVSGRTKERKASSWKLEGDERWWKLSRNDRDDESGTAESLSREARDVGKEGRGHLESAEKVKDGVGERTKEREGRRARELPAEETKGSSCSLPSRLDLLTFNHFPQPRTQLLRFATRMSGPPEPEGKLLSEALA